jgi:hypothetical protein
MKKMGSLGITVKMPVYVGLAMHSYDQKEEVCAVQYAND